MDPILETACQHDLAVIQDACEAIGAQYAPHATGGSGRKAGTLGDAAVFAFYPNKQIITGEGGIIVTGNQAWARDVEPA
jgi:perosamine synthetase